MIAKCSCQNCGVHIEFQAEDAGRLCPCPSCGSNTRLTMPIVPHQNTPESARVKEEKKLASRSPQLVMLESLRAYSCYKTYRGLVGGIHAAVQTVVIISFLFPAIGAIISPNPGVDAVFGAFGKFVISGCFILFGFVVAAVFFALRQCALVIFDIADCSILMASRNNSTD